MQDTNYQLQQTCEIARLDQAVMAIGCFDYQASIFLCGIDTERHGPDWNSVSITGNFFYPRTLVHAMPDINGDGFGTPELKCYDPLDCQSKCMTLAKTSRQGTGTPAACMMCQAPCPVNILRTISSIVQAIFHDVLQAIRVAAICLAGGGFQRCICSVFGMLEPFWRKVSKNPRVRCEQGDPLGRIIRAIIDQVAVGMVEPMVNTFISAANAILRPPLKFFGFRGFSPVCFRTIANPDRCEDGGLSQEEAAALQNCFDESRGLQNLCYFERVYVPSP